MEHDPFEDERSLYIRSGLRGRCAAQMDIPYVRQRNGSGISNPDLLLHFGSIDHIDLNEIARTNEKTLALRKERIWKRKRANRKESSGLASPMLHGCFPFS